MSYTPTQWKSGDTVTSAKLNKIENGIKNLQSLIINATIASENIHSVDWTAYITLQENMPSYNDFIESCTAGIIPQMIVTENDTGNKWFFVLTGMFIYNEAHIISFSATQNDNSVAIYLYSEDDDAPLEQESII